MGINTETSKSSNMTINPVVSAGISATSGLIDNLFNIGQKSKQRKHENELARYQYEQQKEMIREQNLYNSPENQMKMYGEAGLNPHLAVGKFEPQSQIAKFQAPQQEYGQLDLHNPVQGSIANFQQAKMQQAQVSSIQAQTRTQQQLALNAAYTGQGLIADNKKKNILLPTHLEQAQANIASALATAGLTDEKRATQVQTTAIEAAKAKLAKKNIFPGDNNYKIELKQALDWIKKKLLPQGLDTKFPKYKW